jgi:hypothetical protein
LSLRHLINALYWSYLEYSLRLLKRWNTTVKRAPVDGVFSDTFEEPLSRCI